MEFLKAFVLDGTEHKLNILWENEEPLFRAKEIGKVLGMVNIRETIKNYDENERVVRIIDSSNGEQETTFLTECGLYRLLMASRKPAARAIEQIHPITGEVVQRFVSMVDITKSIRVARASLQDAITNSHILKGFVWRYAQ